MKNLRIIKIIKYATDLAVFKDSAESCLDIICTWVNHITFRRVSIRGCYPIQNIQQQDNLKNRKIIRPFISYCFPGQFIFIRNCIKMPCRTCLEGPIKEIPYIISG